MIILLEEEFSPTVSGRVITYSVLLASPFKLEETKPVLPMEVVITFPDVVIKQNNADAPENPNLLFIFVFFSWLITWLSSKGSKDSICSVMYEQVDCIYKELDFSNSYEQKSRYRYEDKFKNMIQWWKEHETR